MEYSKVLRYLLLATAFLVFTSAKPNERFKVVKTKLGQIEGKIHPVVTDNGKTTEVYEFRNIPYAQPPVGDLRWRPPVSVKKYWRDVLRYNTEEIWCKQIFHIKEIGREDCLVLTVRQPRTANKTKRLPVMFWIHGGALAFGSGNWYYPDEQFSASMEMVTVSINYRLNVFGFTSLKELWSTGKYYGNYGIMDMIEALKWVQRNIEHFGGDAKDVTIIGESAGGAAIYSLITSPAAKGLFNKAIPVSGYPVAPESNFNRAERRYGDLYRKDLNCTQSAEHEIAECLRKKDSRTILWSNPMIRHPLKIHPFLFPYNERYDDFPARVLDNILLPKPIGELREFHTPGLKILMGGCAQEAPPIPYTGTWFGLKRFLQPRMNSFTNGLLDVAIKTYTERRDNEKITPSNMTSQYLYMSMASDVFMTCQNNEIMKNLSRIGGADLYQFMVSQPFSFNPWNGFKPYAYHGIGVDALFGFKSASYRKHPLVPPSMRNPYPSDADKKLSINIRNFIKQFVHETDNFHTKYSKKTVEFWDNKLVTWNKSYHDKECQSWKDHRVLRRAFGQLNLNPIHPNMKKIV